MLQFNADEIAIASAIAEATGKLNILLQQAHDAGLTLSIRVEGPSVEETVQVPSGIEEARTKAQRIIIETLAKR